MKPGYKQTEVGVIPVEWEVRTIRNASEMVTVGFVGSMAHLFTANGVPLLRGQNVLPGRIDLTDTKFISAETHSLWKKSALRGGDIVIVRVGYPGTSAVVPSDFGDANAASLVVVRPDSSCVSSDFMCWVLLSEIGRRQVKAALVGGAQQVINIGMAASLLLPVPAKPEQRAIATALSDVDGLLGGLDRLIAKKRDLKQAAMQQLLTGQTRLPGFRGAWEVQKLGDIVEKIVGGGTPSRANPAFWGREIPWVTVKDFATFNPQHPQESITQLGLRNSASHLIPAGTLITSTRMALGKAVVYEVDVSINQDLKALFLKPEVSVVYLTYWFEHFGSLIDDLGSGSTVKGISLGELRRFPFQAPPHPEQTAIASVLREMDGELAALEQRREKTRALKQAMMQELLTGKTRLI